MNFRPDNIFLGKNQDGSPLRIEEWNYNAYAGFELAGGLANLLWLIFFGFLLSPFFVYLTITMYNGRFNAINVVGLLVGGFLTYDALNGGFFTIMTNIFCDETFINILIYLNIISIIIHGFLIIFGGITHKLIVKCFDTVKVRYIVFYLIIICLVFVGIMVTPKNINKVGWLDTKISNHVDGIRREIEITDSIAHAKELKRMDEYQ